MINKLKRIWNTGFMAFNDEIQNISSTSSGTYGTIHEDEESQYYSFTFTRL